MNYKISEKYLEMEFSWKVWWFKWLCHVSNQPEMPDEMLERH